GLGFRLEFDRDMIVPNGDLSLAQGAIDANGWNMEDDGWSATVVKSVCDEFGVPFDKPWKDLTRKQQDVVLFGTKGKKVKVKYINRYNEERVYQASYEGIIN